MLKMFEIDRNILRGTGYISMRELGVGYEPFTTLIENDHANPS